MKPARRKRLLLIVLIILAVAWAIGIAMYAMNRNINVFYSPTQVKKEHLPQHYAFRVGGLVEKGSLSHANDSMSVSFVLTDTQNRLRVHYKGILPDLFREGQGIVAQGELNEQGDFIATQVLAKHDENYMPPEVKDALDKAGDSQA